MPDTSDSYSVLPPKPDSIEAQLDQKIKEHIEEKTMPNKFDMHERALLELLFGGQESEVTSYEVPVCPECDYRFDGVMRVKEPAIGATMKIVGSSCRSDDLERVVMRQMVAKDVMQRAGHEEPLFCVVVTDWTGSRKAAADLTLLEFANRTSGIRAFAYEGENKLRQIGVAHQSYPEDL